jgi:lipoprotein-anchoring transpeptidase ErfK/SrfK
MANFSHGLLPHMPPIPVAMPASALALLMLSALVLQPHPVLAAQKVRAEIDLSQQHLYLYVDGQLDATWHVSTARPGYRTPTGTFRPIRLERTWRSRKYDWAPMPYSVFFLGGYAIHGTNETKRLGRPVSHGCVRLGTANARRFFELVREVGRSNTRIVIRR